MAKLEENHSIKAKKNEQILFFLMTFFHFRNVGV